MQHAGCVSLSDYSGKITPESEQYQVPRSSRGKTEVGFRRETDMGVSPPYALANYAQSASLDKIASGGKPRSKLELGMPKLSPNGVLAYGRARSYLSGYFHA